MASQRTRKASPDARDLAYTEVQSRADAVEPRARAIRYLPERHALQFDLLNGCEIVIPLALLPLELPNGADLVAGFQDPMIYGGGEYVLWESLEEGMTVPGAILSTLYGREIWRLWSEGWGRNLEEAEARIRSEQARKAGTTRSPAKSAAARANGTKGGRPRNLPPASGE